MSITGEDRDLGMDQPISRRDFVQGVAVSAATLAMTQDAVAATGLDTASAAAYPPMRTGMRGDHPGSFEDAPGMNHGEKFSDPISTGETYDLVVVGGGLSGLAAANFFRQRAGADATILVLDNHDDFGGHAKRNEFIYNGKQMFATGGSAYMVAPHTWTRESIALIDSLGIDWRRPRYGERGLQSSFKLAPATFFRKEVYGRDVLVMGTPLKPTAEFLAQAPLSDRAKSDLVELMTGTTDYMAGMTPEEKIAKLRSISYHDYLLDIVKLQPDALAFTQGVWCLGNDMSSAWFAYFRYKPGFAGLGLKRPDGSPESPQSEGDDYHLPAGNSDIARLMVRALIPEALAAGDVASVETLHINYGTLDTPGKPARIRLSSIVIRAKHVGPDPAQFEPEMREVEVSYVKDGKVQSVRARNVVMAGMNNVIPYLCPEMPASQKAALKQAVRAANQETNVIFRNWQAFAKLGVGNVTCPASFYGRFGMSTPTLMGAMTPTRDPSEPVLVNFGTGANSGILSNPAMVAELTGNHAPPSGTDMDSQFRAVRAGILRSPLDVFERAVRRQAAGALAAGGFDPARDIVAITVNRWPHGFATGRNVLFDKTGANDMSPTIPARQKFGRITIANSDSVGQGLAQTAISEAWRAVSELEPRDYGYFETF